MDADSPWTTALRRLGDLAGQSVPDELLAWADRCHTVAGFPLLGTARCAEPYVALQWNGERVSRAGLGMTDLVVLTGLVAAWQHDRTLGELQAAVDRALQVRADVVMPLAADAPVTADVVTAAVCAGVLAGVPEDELTTLVDLAGTLLQVQTSETTHTAAGHTAAAGWLAVQVHLAGMVAYPGAFADTVATAALDTVAPGTDTPGTDALASRDLTATTPARTFVDGLR